MSYLDEPDWASSDPPDDGGEPEEHAYREGIAEGVRLERARVVAFLKNSRAGEDYYSGYYEWHAGAAIDRGEHVPEKTTATTRDRTLKRGDVIDSGDVLATYEKF
jgi:hypothetical protein